MPELPEVETQVCDLQAVIGRKILAIKSDTPKSFVPALPTFRRKVVGQKIVTVRRRAKFIIFEFASGDRLVAHLRMTGHFLLAKSAAPLEKFVRHSFQLSGDKLWLQFSDIRKFGTLRFFRSDQKIPELEKLGPEPLERKFTKKVLAARLAARRGKLKAVLLDQTFLAGIGNIYADEICFAARLHPSSKVENLKPKEVEKLWAAIRSQLKKGVKNRGTTIGEFVDAHGRPGCNQKTLRVYRRAGSRCFVCGAVLQKMKISQRTTTFCVRCQRVV